MSFALRFIPAGERAVFIELGDRIDPVINRQVRALLQVLDEHRVELPGLGDVIPGYRSLLVEYDPAELSLNELQSAVGLWHGQMEETVLPPPRTVEIPTLYGGEMGPDLEFVAQYHGLTPAAVIELHAGAEYRVYLMGFAPGFPYLGGLPKELVTPRLESPRLRVPAGSVAIGGEQTGIYPFATAGGWRIIGRTPIRLFDPRRPQPFLLAPGDIVRFVPITAEEFRRLERA